MADDTEKRPTLTDVLGAIVASVSRARAASDAAAVQIAQIYRHNDILRTLPVPRVRIHRIAIDLPLVVHEFVPGRAPAVAASDLVVDRALQAMMEESRRLETEVGLARDSASPSAALASLAGTLDEARKFLVLLSREREGTPSVRFRLQLCSSLDSAIKELPAGTDGTVANELLRGAAREATTSALRKRLVGRLRYLQRVEGGTPISEADITMALSGEVTGADDLSAPQRNALQRLAEALPFLIAAVAGRAAPAIIAEPGRDADIVVAAETESVKNSGSPNAVTRLSLTLSEEGLEWKAERDAQGTSNWKLLPE